MLAGEQLIVHTAGAGGWGEPREGDVVEVEDAKTGSGPALTRANGSVGIYSTAQNECD